ncbi:hypothetical protein M758_7G118100 [Ceratodon purpureus]|uniref:F-box domain-containing protein n=1 Tax=Ceratodon purpureus TaxID=3225 RepID=A0A8T0HA83_CERPU|nr:hypothetical protein KC19_7G158700 [Ceratodon purpureus]KAG0611129.1 hypothetical protein M758_7G118100 [Ceratodon purpureus]
MDLDEKLWSLLPTELIERMVSFLPVLDLCRLRSVCRRWNELICKESFHDLCEQNRKENAYLFVTRHHDYHDWCEVDPKFKRTMSLFDLDSRRWYSLTPHVEPHVEALLAVYEDDPTCQMLDMDDGLVCDMTISDDGLTISDPVVLTISDPIARMRKELPLLVTMMPDDEAVPIIVTAVDHVTRSYRLFVITDNDEPDRRIFMYESATDEWRGLKSPPVHLGLRTAVSAVSFGGMLYVIFRLFPARRFLLLSYDLQEDVWKLHSLKIPNKKSRPPQLVVSCNRLFTMMWIGEQRPSAHEQGSHRLLFEVREVLVAEFSSRMVVQLTTTQLQQMFGEEDTANFDIAYGVPCFSSSGSCKSLVLMSFLSGKLISYDLASGLVVALPAHPAKPNEFREGYNAPLMYYQGKRTNLSLRSLSSPLLG